MPSTGREHPELRGQVALVTGGSRGLGLLIARELLEAGCRVAICARDGGELERAARILRRTPNHGLLTVVCDVTDAEDADNLVARVTSAFGPVDLLVNNAGTITVGPVRCAGEREFREAMEVMFFAPLRLALAVLPGMRARGNGRIVNVTSLGGRVPAPHLLPYDCAKFAATALSEGLRAELAGDGVSVTTVLPGLMRTGSHHAAVFSGRPEHEYRWFAAVGSMPLVSMSAERAARRIVRAAARRRPELVLTPLAKAATRVHGVVPATTTRLLTLTDRFLPKSGAAPGTRTGSQIRAAGATPVVDRIAVLNERAAMRLNQS